MGRLGKSKEVSPLSKLRSRSTNKKNKKSKTKAEIDHLAKVAALGCVVCKQPANVHHIRTGMGMAQRASHFQTIPLCYNHHQGNEGIHTLGTKAWQKKYGSELDLLKSVNFQLISLAK